jgi:2-polyprenyl-3-methyl-5-hydroxy-6-metoxy-1,4-benzoquinol methylase
MLNLRSNARILDIGGGHAQVAVPLVKNGFRVTVTGSSEVCRARLEKLLCSNSYGFVQCDLLNLPFKNNSFDAALAFRLLPHVDKWRNLISEMCRVSVNLIIFDYPDIRSFNILYRLLFNAKKKFEKDTRSFRLFSRREMLQALDDQNFRNCLFKPQFFIPMVIHRLLQFVWLSKTMEFIFRTIRLTHFFGSPVILKAKKIKANNSIAI